MNSASARRVAGRRRARHTGLRDTADVERSVARSARIGRLERRDTRCARLRDASCRGSLGCVRDSLGATGPRSCPRSALRAARPRGNDHDGGFDRRAPWAVRLGGRVGDHGGGPAARSRGALSRRRRHPLAEGAGALAGLAPVRRDACRDQRSRPLRLAQSSSAVIDRGREAARRRLLRVASARLLLGLEGAGLI